VEAGEDGGEVVEGRVGLLDVAEAVEGGGDGEMRGEEVMRDEMRRKETGEMRIEEERRDERRRREERREEKKRGEDERRRKETGATAAASDRGLFGYTEKRERKDFFPFQFRWVESRRGTGAAEPQGTRYPPLSQESLVKDSLLGWVERARPRGASRGGGGVEVEAHQWLVLI
jgi:hypothetical protein